MGNGVGPDVLVALGLGVGVGSKGSQAPSIMLNKASNRNTLQVIQVPPCGIEMRDFLSQQSVNSREPTRGHGSPSLVRANWRQTAVTLVR